MPRSDSADSQSQAIQEEPLPSTSNEEEDPLAGNINGYLSTSVHLLKEITLNHAFEFLLLIFFLF